GRQRHRAAERLDPVRRRRRVRHGRRDRHFHRKAAAARAGRRGATDQLQICRARRRPGAPLNPRDLRIGRPPSRYVGLLGGSFNPAHEGHRHVSIEALKRLKLDEVWWLVAEQNPLKPVKGMAPFAARLKAAASFARHPRIRVLDLENRLGTHYTIDTLGALVELAARRFARSRLDASAARGLARMKPPAWVFLWAKYDSSSATELRGAGGKSGGKKPASRKPPKQKRQKKAKKPTKSPRKKS